jgi:hypothetical protein
MQEKLLRQFGYLQGLGYNTSVSFYFMQNFCESQ